MSTRVVDRVDDWDERSFTDGYRTLREFASEEFSGVVRAGGAELYMTKGAVVGVRHGDIEDFEDSTGTAYEAPSPALPLLAIMQEDNDEVRAEYYSEKTSVAEVDSTLSDGGFTGYVELADNVLSGDYYMVYHGGRSMSVGFVGASSRLIDGDEAFETANDEVGIYQVRPADVEVIDIPEREPAEPAEGASAGGDDDDDEAAQPTEMSEADDSENDEGHVEETDTAVDESETRATGSESTTGETGSESETSATGSESTTGETGSESATSATESESTTSATESESTTSATESESETSTRDGSPSSTATTSTDATSRHPESDERDGDRTTGERQSKQQRVEDAEQSEHSAEADVDASAASTEAVRTESRQTRARQPAEEREKHRSADRQSTRSNVQSAAQTSLETRAIPSLDPDRTSDPDDNGNARADTLGRSSNRAQQARETITQQRTGGTAGTRTNTSVENDAAQSSERQPANAGSKRRPARAESEGRTASEDGDNGGADTERLSALESQLETREEEITRLESELDRKTTEYEDLKTQLENTRGERDELATEVDRLETELERLETELGAATDAERRMTPSEALAQTDIFPRYNSKGDATLKKAHGGSHRSEDVAGNLRLEKNTQFDSGAVSVAGQTYPEFLESTLQYQFVEWVIGELLFEIRETGNEKALKDLYDALPVVDWADLAGTVDVVYTEEGQETRSQESFDIILRNRMGEPLIVANLNDSRQGATESMMEDLVRSAERVGQSSEAFAGAFLVTRSFFEPAALETASDVTKGGLLKRDKRKSFVNLSRKQGYHLCLVEARTQNFTLLVPEL